MLQLLCIRLTDSLGIVQNRKTFMTQGATVAVTSAATSTIILSPNVEHAAAYSFDTAVPLVEGPPAVRGDATNPLVYRDAMSLLDAKKISWTNQGQRSDNPTWNKSRYRSSSLVSNNVNGGNSNSNAPPTATPIFYPEWMEGYWSVNYKFVGALFPQGRQILSLRTAGAGIGTCLSLPNVGYNPPPHAAHFLKYNCGTFASASTSICTNGSMSVYEDLAYNLPRKFEAFWPQSKVLSVRTNGSLGGREGEDPPAHPHPPPLTPKCFVTGDGCTHEENPNLHLPASRLIMDFDGPTRRSGRLTQSSDVSLIDGLFGYEDQSNRVGGASQSYATIKTHSQYNVNQELQTFYKEICSYDRVKPNGTLVTGRIRVAAFLPKYIREMDGGSDGVNRATGDYDENEAVALYDYRVLMKGIDEVEAASI